MVILSDDNGANIWAYQNNRSSTEIYIAVPNVSERKISGLNQEVCISVEVRNGVLGLDLGLALGVE